MQLTAAQCHQTRRSRNPHSTFNIKNSTLKIQHFPIKLAIRLGIVRKGEFIGTMGDSGNVTGVHLHYEVLLNGQPIDPAPFLQEFF